MTKEIIMAKEKLVLLHSNDMHGDFLAEPRDGYKEGGVALLSGFIKQVRNEEENTGASLPSNS